MDEKDKKITDLRMALVKIHEYMESAADSELIPMWMFQEITKMIERAEE